MPDKTTDMKAAMGVGFLWCSVAAPMIFIPWRCARCATILMRWRPFTGDGCCPVCKQVQK